MVNNMLYAMYVNESNGNTYDEQTCRAYLDYGWTYEVEEVNMGTSYTEIKLVDFDVYFNSVNFIFFKMNEDDELIEHNIFNDPEYNPYLPKEE